MEKVTVKTKEKCYDVLIGSGLLDGAGKLIMSALGRTCRAMIVSDDAVYPLYGKRLEASLIKEGFSVSSFVFKNGEESKNLSVYGELLESCAEAGITRSDILIALGGGVTGDMTGFAAATYLRCVKFVQIPTTLLADVDSSVGGKTGVNLDAGKNLVGAFYQPEVVICDVDTLKTLTDLIMSDGISEMIKYGMICDEELFEMMESGEFFEKTEECIARCVKIKSDIVSRDEFDNGERQLLNFGHTIGHAIEKASSLKMTHGHAVAAGMAVISRAAENAGISEKCYDRLCAVLEKYSLPRECAFSDEELSGYMRSDKKRKGDSITFVVPEKIGKCVLKTVSAEKIPEILKLGRGE
ncbi:MAG: 3-dehydroquinate synthase [Clostridiales bacterium]|nr:3-dehydroquinate synthase [Clostridiales bacterium]